MLLDEEFEDPSLHWKMEHRQTSKLLEDSRQQKDKPSAAGGSEWAVRGRPSGNKTEDRALVCVL